MSQDSIIKLDEYWPYQVTVLADLISRHTTSVLKTHGGLNLSQWRVLAAVAEKPGRTAADVVTVTPMDKGIVSRATASLVSNGLLEKIADADDKRRSRLYMTRIGEATYLQVSNALTTQTGSIAVSDKLNEHLLTVIDKMTLLND